MLHIEFSSSWGESGRLLGVDAVVGRSPCALRASGNRLARALSECRLDRSLRTLRTLGSRQALEVASPIILYARRIAKVLLVEGVEKGGVAAKERCRFEHGEAQTAKR